MQISRRNTLKSIGASSVWMTPVIQTVILPAHAQTSGVCTTEIVPGIRVTVVDINTLENISCITAARISDGSGYGETLSNANCVNQGVLEGAFERAGTYRMTVAAPGYNPEATIDEIRVVANECHVETVNLNFELTPSID